MKLYSPLINKALKIAYDAHHGQSDKSGTPYIYHPAFLAAQMDTEDEIVTALLHDVVEDTTVTLADLEREGFPPTVLDAVRLLTHKGGSYLGGIIGLEKNPVAVKVKLADLRHNNNPSRNANLPPGEAARLREKYDEAERLLKECAAERDELFRNAAQGNPEAMFRVGVEHYYGYAGHKDRQKAFVLLSRAMEIGLPKERKYVSDECSELYAAKLIAAMLLRDDEGLLSNYAEPYWFEKPPAPYPQRNEEFNDLRDEVSYEERFQISVSIRELFKHITGSGGAPRDWNKAYDISQSIVRKLSFGDRDHQPALDLGNILLAAIKESSLGKVELGYW